MATYEDNEQWKTDGDCSKCRRQKYCSKACKVCKREFRRTMMRAVDEATGGMYSQLMNRAYKSRF